MKNEGELYLHNLWEFWNRMPSGFRNDIINEFESHKGMWDYKILFQGMNRLGNIEKGDIYCLSLLFNIDDIEVCDYFLNKFQEFSPDNYLDHSPWGVNWKNRVEGFIKTFENRESKNTNKNDQSRDHQMIKYLKSLSPSDIYWLNAHYFLCQYSKYTYKHYLHKECSIDRFNYAVQFELNNLQAIQNAIVKILFNNFRNPIIDQYFIYLEKQKEYEKCIEVILRIKDSGWTNDFEARLQRCMAKFSKSRK